MNDKARRTTNAQTMTLRLLRLWHWRRAMSARESSVNHWSRSVNKSSLRLAEFHFAAVSVLDKAPGCTDTTAEYDDTVFPKSHSTKQRRT